MARPTPQSAFRTPHLKRLVPLLLDWFARNARDLPWRRTRDPYAIWVSEIMLQQTQVKTVIPYWERWMRALPTIQDVAKARPNKIHKLWEGLGYYTRARNLQKAARQIVNGRRDELHESPFKNKIRDSRSSSLRKNTHCQFPEKFDDVLALPGIGRYTAGAICSIAFNQPTPVLDGNVIRVLTRVFGIAENPKEKETNARLWKLAEELVSLASAFAALRRDKSHVTHHETKSRTRTRDEDDLACSRLNQSLMELGAVVCTPRNPECGICPVKKLCVAFRENRVAELPNLGQRQAATARRFAAFVIERNGRFLVRQRPAGVVNAHLWEFPNVEVFSNQCSSGHQSAHFFHKNGQSRLTSAATIRKLDPEIALAAEQLGFNPYGIKPLCTVKHSITRYRITLDVFRVHLGGMSYTNPCSRPARSGTRITRPSETRPSEIGSWKTPAQMQQLAFSSAHKRISNQLAAPK